jgi:hypothetical protein
MPIRGFAIGLVLTGVGCTSVQRVQPSQFIPQHRPQFVWVTTTDSDVTTVVGPRIDGDTLRGTVAGLQERVAIPLTDILNVKAKAPDRAKTMILVTGGVVVGGALAYLLTQRSGPAGPGTVIPVCSDPDIDDCPNP